MVRYSVICYKCKAKRTYDEETFGECLDLSERDGWVNTGTSVKCGKCATEKETATE